MATTFFVVDEDARTVAFWLASVQEPAHEVLRWQLPADARLEPLLVAEWAREDTLVVAVPGEWRGGLPQQVVLHRVTLQPGGTAMGEPILTLRRRGGERGLVLQELVISPDATALAYRLRHYTELSANEGRFDTLHVAPTDDLHARIQLMRATPGAGLSWAPHGAWLATGIRGQVAVLSSDGRTVTYVSDESGRAAYPRWIGPREVWFSAHTGNGSRIMRAQIR